MIDPAFVPTLVTTRHAADSRPARCRRVSGRSVAVLVTTATPEVDDAPDADELTDARRLRHL